MRNVESDFDSRRIDRLHGTMEFQRGKTKVIIHNSGDVEIETKNVDEENASESSPQKVRSIKVGGNWEESYFVNKEGSIRPDTSGSTSEIQSPSRFLSDLPSPIKKISTPLSMDNFVGYRPVHNSSQSAAGVVAAFRELQSKIKKLEEERIDAISERDDLRMTLENLERKEESDKLSREMETREKLREVNSSNEHLTETITDLKKQLELQSKLNATTQESISRESTNYNKIHDKCLQLKMKVRSMEQDVEITTISLQNVSAMTSNLTNILEPQHIRGVPKRSIYLEMDLKEIQELQVEKHREQSKCRKLVARRKSLSQYIEMLLSTNRRLSETLIDTYTLTNIPADFDSSLRSVRSPTARGVHRGDIRGRQDAFYHSHSHTYNPHSVDVEADYQGNDRRGSPHSPVLVTPGRARGSEEGEVTRSGSAGRGRYGTRVSSPHPSHPSDRSAMDDEHPQVNRYARPRSAPTTSRSVTFSPNITAVQLSPGWSARGGGYDPEGREGDGWGPSRRVSSSALSALTEPSSSPLPFKYANHPIGGKGRVFVPSSPEANTEFNVIANISKANRAVHSLNASISSK